MRVHHRVFYLPTKGEIEGERTQKWWDAWNLTVAVKDGTLKGYIQAKVNGKPVRIDKSNAHLAREIFGTWLLRVAQEEVGAGKNFALVPIPSKDAVVGTRGPYRSTELMSVALKGDARVRDILRYTEKLKKASSGGPRFAEQIYPKLRVEGRVPKVPVVLVDDVMTSGGHMKAARKRLAEAGCDVRCGIVWGRTVHSTNFDPFAAGVIEIDDSITPFDILDF